MQQFCIKEKSSANLGLLSTILYLDYSFHIPGKENCEADFEPRREYKDAEWILNPKIFNQVQKIVISAPGRLFCN